ncbi:hypothetical protein AX15_001326 [Amanita polypyramis BW_CC]|nr:hypothetical protein AX15_001326 [Amanita polypyramis BW_CC]
MNQDSHEKYMTYLPHSGFHNQRIALENALVLSILLNRTLIIPPMRLGWKPIRYVNYESLSRFHMNGGKEGLHHCSTIPSHMTLPSECFDYFDYTHLPWNWLVNITQYTRLSQFHERNLHGLNFNDGNSTILSDESPYHYRFHDTPLNRSAERTSKYRDHIYIYDIANSSKRFLRFGTLFGSSRLLLKNLQNLAIRGTIRRSMVFANPMLASVVDNIRAAIGGPYVGAHVRITDGQFEKDAASNIREVWWKLIRTCYGYSHSEGLELERVFQQTTIPNDSTLFSSPGSYSLGYPTVCHGRLYENPHLAPLNLPLFISTDAENPRAGSSFSIFSRTFPCLMFISDFLPELEPLSKIRNEDDGLQLIEFVVPFLDAMVLGHASAIVTIEGSTFGRFVEDVLGRVYHDQKIVQRG